MNQIDLKKSKEFLNQYVNLRNRYCEVLMTTSVNLTQTLKWIEEADIDIRGIVENNKLMAVVIIYFSKGNEVTIFARGQGYGKQLLKIANEIAKEHDLPWLWAWTLEDNLPAIKLFEKYGYKKKNANRYYQGKKISGYIFTKLCEKQCLGQQQTD